MIQVRDFVTAVTDLEAIARDTVLPSDGSVAVVMPPGSDRPLSLTRRVPDGRNPSSRVHRRSSGRLPAPAGTD